MPVPLHSRGLLDNELLLRLWRRGNYLAVTKVCSRILIVKLLPFFRKSFLNFLPLVPREKL